MKEKLNWKHAMYVFGIIALVIGVLDPLEGSILIGIGSVTLSLSTYLTHDRHWKIFLIAFILIVIGLIFLFYFSSIGGFGGKSTLSWWWGTLILPYPIGWLIDIITLVVRAIGNIKKQI